MDFSAALPQLIRLAVRLGVARCVVALSIGAAVVVPSAAGSSGGRVVYTTYKSGPMLATINPDGSNTRVIIAGREPAWSSNGRWIAYTHDYSEIWRVRPDGTDARRIVRFRIREASTPVWSPTGDRIAFAVTWSTGSPEEEDDVEHSAVYVANRDGSGKRLLCRDAFGPAWSPNGRRIAVQTPRGIATVKPNGHGFTVLHRPQETFAYVPLRFSPNGRWLLFQTYTSGTETTAAIRVSLLNMRTGRVRQIPLDAMPGWPADVTWTPDGKIAFLYYPLSRQDGGSAPLVPDQLRTIERDGTDAQTLANLTEGALPNGGLSWRPTG